MGGVLWKVLRKKEDFILRSNWREKGRRRKERRERKRKRRKGRRRKGRRKERHLNKQ